MNVKQSVKAMMILTLGFVLNTVIPPFLLGMKPDFLLVFMFVALNFVEKPKDIMIIIILAMIFAAVSSVMAGGFIANAVDKCITGCLYVIVTQRMNRNLITETVTVIIGTMVSGIIFLLTLFVLGFLPSIPVALFITIVLPTALLNGLLSYILYVGAKRAHIQP